MPPPRGAARSALALALAVALSVALLRGPLSAAPAVRVARAQVTLATIDEWTTSLGLVLEVAVDVHMGAAAIQQGIDASFNYQTSVWQPDLNALLTSISGGLEIELQNRSTFVNNMANSAKTIIEKIDTDPSLCSGCATYSQIDLRNAPPNRTYSTTYLKYVSMTHSATREANSETSSALLHQQRGTTLIDSLLNQTVYDSLARWSYIALTSGMWRMYPGQIADRAYSGLPRYRDARLRPWFTEAASGERDMVLILDATGSMVSQLSLLKSIADTLINGLGQLDYVNVIVMQGGSASVLTCWTNALVGATPSVKSKILSDIDAVTAYGLSDYTAAFKLAFDLLRDSDAAGFSTYCRKFVVLISDLSEPDSGHYLSEAANNEVCIPNCPASPTGLVDLYHSYNASLSGTRVFLARVGDSTGVVGADLSCASSGALMNVPTADDLATSMGSLFSVLYSANSTSPTIVSPYIDLGGLGLLTTIAMSIHNESSTKANTLMAVVGLDVNLDVLADTVLGFKWGQAYLVLLNHAGQAIFHPRIKEPDAILSAPEYPDFALVEGVNTTAMATLKNNLLTNEGVEFSQNITRLFPKGETAEGFEQISTKNMYMSRKVNTTNWFLVLVALDPDDLNYHYLPEGQNVTMLPYHLLNISSAMYGIPIIKSTDPANLYYNTNIFPDNAVYFLSRSAFCSPGQYMTSTDTIASITTRQNLFASNSSASQFGCPTGTYHIGVRGSAQLGSSLQDLWNISNTIIRQLGYTTFGSFRYVASLEGVMFVFPGVELAKTYVPSVRPWFRRAAVARGYAVLSNPYVDVVTGRLIVTISKPLYPKVYTCRGSSNSAGCPCNSSSDCSSGVCVLSTCRQFTPTAVIAEDILWPVLYTAVRTNLSRCNTCGTHVCGAGTTQCALVTEDGYVVYHYSLQNLTTTALTHISSFYPGVIYELVYRHKAFTASSFKDFDSTCSSATAATSNSTLIDLLVPHLNSQSRSSSSSSGGGGGGGGGGGSTSGKRTRLVDKTDPEHPNYYRNIGLGPGGSDPRQADRGAQRSPAASGSAEGRSVFVSEPGEPGYLPTYSPYYDCVTNRLKISVNQTMFSNDSFVLTGTVANPCNRATFFIRRIPNSRTYLLVLDNFVEYTQAVECKLFKGLVSPLEAEESQVCSADQFPATRKHCDITFRNVSVPCAGWQVRPSLWLSALMALLALAVARLVARSDR